jgi:MYXO-CTERM domain-containing protein
MTKMSRNAFVLGFGPALVLALIAHAAPAHACGGLFCSASAPVNQAAERIIFSKNADQTVTAVVQIQYEGPSEEFAWVLPVPGVPKVEVSSDLAFTRLQQASNPQYNLTTEVEGRCKTDRNGSLNASAPSADAGSGGSGGSGGFGGVNVLASGTVGPYDFVVIRPEASYERIGDVAVEWLTFEGYDVVPPGGDPDDISALLGEYLQGGMNLIAFRLTKGNNTGTIRPIRITYDSEQPMIPIRPTAVAANDDMGVMVWVLGESRAVPVNYKSLELNQALINWLTGGSNYNQVVIAAANEAGGQGFVSERAGLSSDYDNVIIFDFEKDDWEALQMSAMALTPFELLAESTQRFGGWDGYRGLLEDFLPESVDVDQFLSCPGCDPVALDGLDTQAFIEGLAEEVVEPMIATQELLGSRPYVTRLYTTLSAPEMDLDPLFDFNPDLPALSNVHTARQVIECHRSVYIWEAPSRFHLEDGRVVRVSAGDPWPFTPGDEEAPPASALVLELTTSGPGTVVEDNSEAIDQALAEHNGTVPSPSGCGCGVVAPRSSISAWAALALFALLRWRRRRPA